MRAARLEPRQRNADSTALFSHSADPTRYLIGDLKFGWEELKTSIHDGRNGKKGPFPSEVAVKRKDATGLGTCTLPFKYTIVVSCTKFFRECEHIISLRRDIKKRRLRQIMPKGEEIFL